MAFAIDQNKDHPVVPVILGGDKIWGPTDADAITDLPQSPTRVGGALLWSRKLRPILR